MLARFHTQAIECDLEDVRIRFAASNSARPDSEGEEAGQTFASQIGFEDFDRAGYVGHQREAYVGLLKISQERDAVRCDPTLADEPLQMCTTETVDVGRVEIESVLICRALPEIQ